MDKRFQEFILNDTASVSFTRFAFNLVVAFAILCIAITLRSRWTSGSAPKPGGNLFTRSKDKANVKLRDIMQMLKGCYSRLSLSRLDDWEKALPQLSGRYHGVEFTYMESTPIFNEN